MEVLTLLDTIKEMMERSATIPFSRKSLIDKDEVLDVVKEIEEKLPDELKQAKWVKEERQKILLDAQKEANDLIKEQSKPRPAVASRGFWGLYMEWQTVMP